MNDVSFVCSISTLCYARLSILWRNETYFFTCDLYATLTFFTYLKLYVSDRFVRGFEIYELFYFILNDAIFYFPSILYLKNSSVF